jgi:hypothetical protein
VSDEGGVRKEVEVGEMSKVVGKEGKGTVMGEDTLVLDTAVLTQETTLTTPRFAIVTSEARKPGAPTMRRIKMLERWTKVRRE